MNKIKASMNICNNFKNVFRAGYCDLQHIFHGVEPVYYNSGKLYGWNCDMYVDYATDTILTTGYRNMRGERVDYDTIQKYDAIAQEIIEKYRFGDDEKKNELLEKNRNDFI